MESTLTTAELIERRKPGRPCKGSEPCEAILRAAMQVISEVGYERMTIEAVAERAHASKATIYRHFKSKSGLVLALCEQLVEQLGLMPDSGCPRNDIETFISNFVEVIALYPLTKIVAFLSAHAAVDAELAETLRSQLILPRHLAFEEKLRSAQAAGFISADKDPGMLRAQVFGSIYYRILITGEGFDSTFARDLLDTVFAPLSKEEMEAAFTRSISAHVAEGKVPSANCLAAFIELNPTLVSACC